MLSQNHHNQTPLVSQNLMEARQEAIRQRKEEQTSIIKSRKRKLEEIYCITHLLQSGSLDGIDADIEAKFYKSNDLASGRLYDDSQLELYLPIAARGSSKSLTTVPSIPGKLTISSQDISFPEEATVRPNSASQVAPSRAEKEEVSRAEPDVIKFPTNVTAQSPHADDTAEGLELSSKRRKLSDARSRSSSEEPLHRTSSVQSPEKDHDISAPIVNIDGVPVIQSSLPPATHKVLRVSEPRPQDQSNEDNNRLIASGHLPPPPPPISSVSPEPRDDRLDRKIKPLNGDSEAIQEDVRRSLEKLTADREPMQSFSNEKQSQNAHPSSIQQVKKALPPSHSQLKLVPPTAQIPSQSQNPSPQTPQENRHHTPSSPITSDDDDDDHDNTTAVISSATSPDAAGIHIDEHRLSHGSHNKNDQTVRIGDPSAQLMLEDQLSRKGQSGALEHKEVENKQEYPNDSLVTGESVKPPANGFNNGIVEKRNSQEVSPELEDNLPEAAKLPQNHYIANVAKSSPSPQHDGRKEPPSPPALSGEERTNSATSGKQEVNNEQDLGPRQATLSRVTLQNGTKILPSQETSGQVTNQTSVLSASAPVDARFQPESQTKLTQQEHKASTTVPASKDTSETVTDAADETSDEMDLDSDDSDDGSKIKVLPSYTRHRSANPDTPMTSISNVQATNPLPTAAMPPVSEVDKENVDPDANQCEVTEPAASEQNMLRDNTAGNVTEGVPSTSGLLRVLEVKQKRDSERARLAKVVFLGPAPTSTLQSRQKKSQTSLKVKSSSMDMTPMNNKRISGARHGTLSSMSGLHVPPYGPNDYMTPLYEVEAFEKPLQSLVHTSHKTILTSNHQVSLHEQQLKKIYRKVEELQEKGLWSLRQPPRAVEPRRKLCQWDFLIKEALWMSNDFHQERKNKIVQCKFLADIVSQYHKADENLKPLLQVDKKEFHRRLLERRAKRKRQEQGGDVIQSKHRKVSESMIDVADASRLVSPCDQNADPTAAVTRERVIGHSDDQLPLTASPGAMDIQEDYSFFESEMEDMFGQFTKPPEQLFTLGAEEFVFNMADTDAARKVLSELPLYGPPVPPSPSDSASQYEPLPVPPIVAVSKYAEGKINFTNIIIQPKKSRFQYHEHPFTPSEEEQRELDEENSPPRNVSVALFQERHKGLLQRMHQGHGLKPPSYLPPISFFENRQASQWTAQEDDKLKDLVQRYSQNWQLVSTFMSFKGELQSSLERRSEWECFERYLQIENISPEFAKNPFYRGIQQRLEIANKVTGPAQPVAGATPTATPSVPGTPTVKRRSNVPIRVDRRKNTKSISMFECMRKQAKRRELSLTKQQNAAGIASRKAEQQSQTKHKLQNFNPVQFSRMRHERDMKAEKLARENMAAALAQRNAGQLRVQPPYPPGLRVPGPIPHPRTSTPGVHQGVMHAQGVNAAHAGNPALQMHRAAALNMHGISNGTVPTPGGAPVPGIPGGIHNSIPGVSAGVNGMATANAIAALQHRQAQPTNGMAGRPTYTPEQIAQFHKIKQLQSLQHQVAHGQSNGTPGSPIKYPTAKHAVYAAAVQQQQAALDAAANTTGPKQHTGIAATSPHLNKVNGLPQHLPVNFNAQAASPRLAQPPQIHQQASQATNGQPTQQQQQWFQGAHGDSNDRIAEYHQNIRNQLANSVPLTAASLPPGINFQQYQAALARANPALAQQLQQQIMQRQASQTPSPVQQQLPSTVVGGVVSRPPPPTQHLLQRTPSLQGSGHPLQQSQLAGVQLSPQAKMQYLHKPQQRQSPIQAHAQQAQMANMAPPPTPIQIPQVLSQESNLHQQHATQQSPQQQQQHHSPHQHHLQPQQPLPSQQQQQQQQQQVQHAPQQAPST